MKRSLLLISFFLSFASLFCQEEEKKKDEETCFINSFEIESKKEESETRSTIQVLSWTPRIFLIENFLTPFECDYLIEQSKPFLSPSTVVSPHSKEVVINPARTSTGMFFPSQSTDPILAAIEKRIAELCHLPVENGEGIQVLHYKEGDQYRPHFDYFDPHTEGGAYHYNRGGQRIATVLMYLADTEQGGETLFPKAKLKIRPVKGNAILFYNCTPSSEEDPLSLHGGAPVIKGEKWVATKWIRSSEFR